MYSRTTANLTSAAKSGDIARRRSWSQLAFLGKPQISGMLAALTLTACGGVNPEVPAGEFTPPVVAYQVVFEDDFDGNTLDAAKWTMDVGDGCAEGICGWGNAELQSYETDNVSVAGGYLRIEGRREANGSYTSGRINTRGKFDFQYGRVEVSARIPSGQGTWPAIWLLHTPLDRLVNGEQYGAYGPWPLSGEIDIMEAFNYRVNGDQTVQSTTHYGLPIEPFNGTNSKTDLAINADMAFHEYAVEWEKGRIRFFVDGRHFQTQIIDEYYAYYPGNDDGLYDPIGPYRLGLEDAPFDQLFHLIINFAIGGNPVGDPDMNTTFPQTMEVDYVRIYECVNSNPDTRRGCGSADPSIEPLEDLDGGPLENATTAKPFVESLDLYLDAPEVITVNVGGQSATNTLQASIGFDSNGNATVVNDPAFPDPDDAANTVWHVGVAGDVANVLLTGEDLTADPLLDTGFDFSSGAMPAPVGEIAFDMQINSITPGTNLVVKLDSGFPNLGEFAIPEADLLIGDWKTYSVKFSELLANPGFTFDPFFGTGVDLENVINPFVFEVAGGDVDVYLDNIRVTNACYLVGGCSASARTKGLPDVIIFDDAVNTALWDRGIGASDSGTNFTDYFDGGGPGDKVNWSIITDPDDPATRGQVVDVTFNDSPAAGVLFFLSSNTNDLSAYDAGAVVFDIIVTDYGNNTQGMMIKVDCIIANNCTSGDTNIGVVGDGAWETVEVPVARLKGGGLDTTLVTAGIAVYPNFGDQNGTIRFRLDNIRWVEETAVTGPAQIDLPVTFDEPGVDYSLADFGGTSTIIVDDPAGGTNQVAQTTHNGGQFAGTVIGTNAGFANPIPFTQTETTLSLRVRSPAAGIPVMLKVEDASDPAIFAEVIATTSVAGDWETLVYDYVGVIDPMNISYEKAVLFFNFPNAGDGSIYYWDDVQFGPGAGANPPALGLPVTFDDTNVDYELNDFGGAATTFVTDPNNMANTVASTNKPPGALLFAGTTVGNVNGFTPAFPFSSTDTQMTVRVYSPDAGIQVRLKVEDSTDPTISVETEATTAVANDWEILTFDFSNEVPMTAALNLMNTYDKVSIFFNFGVDGNTAGDKTYLWEDIDFVVGSAPPQVALPVTFDDSGLDYELNDFNGTATTLVMDPINMANTVASTNKSAAAAFFAGTTVANVNGFDAPIPFTMMETLMSVRVYSPDAGIPVRLKVEDVSDPNISVETEATTTVANEWEVLTFDFSNQVPMTAALDLGNVYDKATIFFNFGTDGATAGDKTYLWENVAFGVQLDLPATFDDPNVDYSLGDFGGNVTTLIADPLDANNTVASSNKPPSALVFAGTTLGSANGLASAFPFSMTETSMNVRVYSPDAGIPVRLKVEDASNPTISVETEATTTTANAWEVLVFDFSNEVPMTAPLNLSNRYDKVSIFFNFGTDGAAAGDKTYLWENVGFGATP